MSEYTPTDDEVRGAYQGQLIKTDTNIYSLIDEDQARAEFDRWLAEVKAEAWDVGYKSGLRNAVFNDHDVMDVNPYRQGEQE